MDSNSDRRQFLKKGIITTGLYLLSTPLKRSFAASCGLTPPQTPGPFYPGESQFHTNNDLTAIPGHASRAQGQVIYVRGKILDQNCNAIKDANIEIWQACASGKYNNSRDPNTAPLDPDFKYWAETFSNENGEYIFKTIIPGAYPADQDWIRPPHIHFKISRLGFKELTTQMYFKNNSLNNHDLILQKIPAHDRESVIIDFQPSPINFEIGSLIGNFDITIHSIRT